jgi:hypothetical protein
MDASDQSSSKGKATDLAGGFRPQVNMEVRPPKPEDLQKSYASVVDEVHSPGWYGGMSTSSLPDNPGIARPLIHNSQCSRRSHWVLRRHSVLCLLSESL